MNEIPVVEITRVIKCSKNDLYEAWTRLDILARWFAPFEMKVARIACDPVPGGQFEVEMSGSQYDENPVAYGKYLLLNPYDELKFSWNWRGSGSGDSEVTVRLREVEGGTELNLIHVNLSSAASADSHRHGWEGCLENLDKAMRVSI